ncbi:formylmethionine deformylase [Fusarium albosuccineum]|uniref:Formylmethionine deformylase n=1 Tax=Fusarium albosuccineum TaxID=1237068 RepID=A0A8H4LCR7_9HYPO|nr:formylmethionine deformylase [Fusarium albosuccineum]
MPSETLSMSTFASLETIQDKSYSSKEYLLPSVQNHGKPRLPFPSPWIASCGMYLFFLAGVGFAIGHHFYYASLHGNIVDDQLAKLRWGTALAFAAKASLTASVVSAFQQQVWASLRTRFMTVSALDSMFAATENPMDLLNLEFITGAKTAVALALFGWCAPAIVILTANTLLVEPSMMDQTTMCPGVKSLNFTFEGTYDWRHPGRGKDSRAVSSSVSMWNATSEDEQEAIDYFTAPSQKLSLQADASAVLQRPITERGSALATCERGWNCTINVEMIGPGYKCVEVASGTGSRVRNLSQESGEAGSPFPSTDFLAPTGNITYQAITNLGDYAALQMENIKSGGAPQSPGPLPKTFGAFRTEPVVWIGYAQLNKSTKRFTGSWGSPGYEAATIPKIIACEHYKTRYQVQYNYTDGEQFIQVMSREFLTPVINTTYTPAITANDGTADNTTASPRSNYVLITNTAKYKEVAAYHALGSVFRNIIKGSIRMPFVISSTKALNTMLLNREDYFPRDDLKSLIPSLYEDLIFSTMSNAQFAPVVWAARPDRQVLLNEDDNDMLYPCIRYRPANRYHYSARILWAVYGVAILLALSGVMVGSIALWRNGGRRRDSRFSSIVAATRGSSLSKIDWGGPAVDEGQVNEKVRNLKLGYGLSKHVETEEFPGTARSQVTFSFGCEGDIYQSRGVDESLNSVLRT